MVRTIQSLISKNGNEDRTQITSVGIDIGTSTTKMVISRLTLENLAGWAQVPRIEIVDKEVLYRSRIHPTPLIASDRVDIEKVLSIVSEEYCLAGIKPGEIDTGAVIITGETANKQNARDMVHRMAGEAGEFVVATAGPQLEGIIAGKGSGAWQRSKETGTTVANVDIGGGTANIAVFRGGELSGTCTLHIGGRLMKFEKGRVAHISRPLWTLMEAVGCTLRPGDMAEESKVRYLTRQMAKTLSNVLRGELEETDRLLLVGGPPDWNDRVEELMFSGGVGGCLRSPPGWSFRESINRHGDLGPVLAQDLLTFPGLRTWHWAEAGETIRATVSGAGMQTIEVSGSTIHADDVLPIKNLPVFKFRHHPAEELEKQVKRAIQQGTEMYDPNREGVPFALAMSDLPYMSFRDIRDLSRYLSEALHKEKPSGEPVVLIVDRDLAKVLGQTLSRENNGRPVLCIDQVKVEHGDYIDIGKLLGGRVVPVVVKTLAFST
ncbi:ethanolamine ammonia-lyase reactivating factor EutA [Melghirimyces profundicolus]|uniref:ethanolamine ammonia-lyase reactivating factor EutA n=1 Tax=Melghirimyces profundicolus TaxID=1242148 RepID=UPI0031846814